MPAGRTTAWEHHAPGNVRGSSIELAVDEVAQSSETQADRGDGCGQIRDRVDADLLTLAEPYERHDGTEQSAVKRHAALPDGEELQRVLQIIRKVVEQRVAQPPADKHTQRGPDDHIVDLLFGDR